MAVGATIPFLQESMILLTTAGVVVPLLARLKLSPVLSYLLVGLVVGPSGLILLGDPGGWLQYVAVQDVKTVAALAELGVIFLLFMIGLELSPKKLWALRRQVFGLGLLQVVTTAIFIAAIASLFGNSPNNSILLGACFALSSTAIVMQLLAEKRQTATPVGRYSFSILLFQDLAVVPILVFVSVLGAGAVGSLWLSMGMALGKALVAIVLLAGFGYFLLRPLFRIASGAIGAEAFFAVALLAALGTAALTGMAGLSMALGAFLAGLLLAETEYSHAIETYIAPFKGLLLGLFFMSVGMSLDLRAVYAQLPILSVSVVGIIAIKALIIYLLLRLFGQPRAVAVESGLLLGQAGEFAFVIVGMALTLNLMDADVAQFMLIVAGLSMLATPLVALLARKLAEQLEVGERAATPVPGDELSGIAGHIIIASYGRVGQLLGEVFDRENIPWLAVDSDGGRVAAARAKGKPVYFGDSTNVAMLTKLHPESAQAAVVALDDSKLAALALQALRQISAELPVFVRARDVSQLPVLRSAGATDIVPDTLEASLQLAGRVLTGLGLSADDVDHRLDLLRHELVPV
jgi:CPA2 family monovalent cation:H+ antiporter-2